MKRATRGEDAARARERATLDGYLAAAGHPLVRAALERWISTGDKAEEAAWRHYRWALIDWLLTGEGGSPPPAPDND